ncbi:AraC family transcriptional regulator [uncultured Chitinophaga sp.]|uniref:helix-turn-helix domain-containing protein n=1 Tax=uncultured Chitinophaga sp. TaxID=339340 RepID=UPI0025E746D4|nr:AraC family transcriptional regulator [uncultured Chitinophaga sp.]
MDHFPVLGIQEFSQGKSQDCNILFHELLGERTIDEAHKHDFFIALLFEKGAGTHTIDFVSYPIGEYQLHLLFPGQVHEWKFEQETIGYQLMIDSAPFESFLPSLRFSSAFYHGHPVIDLSPSDYSIVLQEFRAVQQELDIKPVFWQLVQSRCTTLGLLISRIAASAGIYQPSAALSRFMGLIDTHFREQRSVAFYAGEIGISPNYLNILCKRELNVSASSLINDRVLLEAKRLLKASKMSVKEIVFDLGFYDQANFSKFFKGKTGMTAGEFKEG